jgi:hypothetical protein
MCDLSSFQILLGMAGALIAGAIAAVIVAAALNNGFFSAPASPAAMITAGLLTLAAIGVLSAARGAVASYFQCMGAPPACLGALTNLYNALAGLLTVLGIQATACFVVAGFAWIPWVGAVPMYAILGAFIVQLGLIPTVIAFSVALVNCVQKAIVVGVGPSSSAVIAATSLIVLACIVAIARHFQGGKRKRSR